MKKEAMMPNLPADVIAIRMDSSDFEQLCHNSMEWRQGNGSNGWIEQEERFETRSHEDINWDFKYVFWCGMEWSAVIFARAYLDFIKEDYQILWDCVENPDPSWVIITNYPASWERTLRQL